MTEPLDPRLRQAMAVFIGRGGLGVVVALVIAAILLVVSAFGDVRVGALPLVALAGVGSAVVALGVVLHPGLRRAIGEWLERPQGGDETEVPAGDAEPRDRRGRSGRP
jgi:hypothetical protein